MSGDLPFIDALQKKQSRAVGFMPTRQLEAKIEAGQVLIAEGREGEAPAEPGLAHHARGSAGELPSRASVWSAPAMV